MKFRSKVFMVYAVEEKAPLANTRRSKEKEKGIDPKAYEKALKGYIENSYAKKNPKLPPDLDPTPYVKDKRYKEFFGKEKVEAHKALRISTLSRLTPDVRKNLFPVMLAVFGKTHYEELKTILSKRNCLDTSLAALMGDEMVGFYILGPHDMVAFLFTQRNEKGMEIKTDVRPYKGKRGVEGYALGVLPKYEGQGIGQMLINKSMTMGFDYIWGQQYKSLKNIQHWLKRRLLIAEHPKFYVTATELK